MAERLLAGLEEVRRHWGWHLALGTLLLVLGLVAIAYAVTTSLVSVLFFGWMLVVSGVVQGILAFRVQHWSGFFLHLLAALLEIIVGVLVISGPTQAAVGLTLLLAAYLLVGGLFRTLTALVVTLPGAGWTVLGGVISFLLGLAIWRQWPFSGLWFIGTCIGVDLVLHGAAWIVFALKARRLPALPLEIREGQAAVLYP